MKKNPSISLTVILCFTLFACDKHTELSDPLVEAKISTSSSIITIGKSLDLWAISSENLLETGLAIGVNNPKIESNVYIERKEEDPVNDGKFTMNITYPEHLSDSPSKVVSEGRAFARPNGEEAPTDVDVTLTFSSAYKGINYDPDTYQLIIQSVSLGTEETKYGFSYKDAMGKTYPVVEGFPGGKIDGTYKYFIDPKSKISYKTWVPGELRSYTLSGKSSGSLTIERIENDSIYGHIDVDVRSANSVDELKGEAVNFEGNFAVPFK